MGSSKEYDAVHKRAARRRKKSCEMCGRADTLQCAFNPTTPLARVEVDERGLRYSNDPSDYLTLCIWCHREVDHNLKPTCGKGHVFDEANTIWRANGTRRCRECTNQNRRDMIARETPEKREKRLARERGRVMTPEQKERAAQQQRERRARKKQT